MLSKMADTLDVRMKGRSIDIEHLDITSYLSAPNRINTCNAHVGTVYRIFVDLSDMGWWEKHTALYNLATHSMDRIVEAFDPETGQVRKDEHGTLKVQVVIDWPLSAGLSRSEEYKRFFKWAKHLNNYHSEIRDENSPLLGYQEIRYQTRNYDERVKRMNVFSQEERQFLEDYLQLCQLPEFFKPEEIFSTIRNKQPQEEAENKEAQQGTENKQAQKGAENKQAQEEAENKQAQEAENKQSQQGAENKQAQEEAKNKQAQEEAVNKEAQQGAENKQDQEEAENKQAQVEEEKKLQSFVIENETIRCTDASALQSLIPYVKR
jgi:hypothetical protein